MAMDERPIGNRGEVALVKSSDLVRVASLPKNLSPRCVEPISDLDRREPERLDCLRYRQPVGSVATCGRVSPRRVKWVPTPTKPTDFRQRRNSFAVDGHCLYAKGIRTGEDAG